MDSGIATRICAGIEAGTQYNKGHGQRVIGAELDTVVETNSRKGPQPVRPPIRLFEIFEKCSKL